MIKPRFLFNKSYMLVSSVVSLPLPLLWMMFVLGKESYSTVPLWYEIVLFVINVLMVFLPINTLLALAINTYKKNFHWTYYASLAFLIVNIAIITVFIGPYLFQEILN